MNQKDNPESAKRLSIGRNMLWNSVGSMVYLACQWLITVLVVRLSSGFDAAGALALGMAVSNIFTPIGQYKIRAFQVSDVTGEYTAGQYIAHRFVTIGLAVVVMLVYAEITCPANQLLPIYLYGVFSFGPIFVDVLHGEDQRASRMDCIGISCIMRGVGSLLSFSAVLWATDSLSMALIAMTLATFLVISFYDVPQTRKLVGSLRPDFNKEKIASLLKICAPAVVALFLCSAIPAIPRQILNSQYGSDTLGDYASVASPVLIIQMGAQYVYAPMLTEFANKYHAGEQEGFFSLFKKVALSIVFITIVGIVGFQLAGNIILEILYGSDVVQYSYILLPLVVCTALTAYIWFIGDLLIAIRDMKGNLITYAIAMTVCLVSMSSLIGAWGMNGVSFTIILSFAAALVYAIPRIFIITRKSFGR